MIPLQAWQAALGQLQAEMPKASFDTWVSSAEMLEHRDGCFVIGVKNTYARDWLADRLTNTVNRILSGLLGSPQSVRFIVGQRELEPAAEEAASEPEAAAPLPACINPRYTFETFIVGSSNRLAHAACLNVAENPAHAYNPLFVYGGVGLGKTHLLNAVGNCTARKGLRVLYVSSEEFTNDFINSIQKHNNSAFRDRYRSIDVLMVDDIHFIAGKESTQEEFFHTFNTLHRQDKQIIISSDRPPKAMVTLEERLRSRFEMGLIVDIQPPDLETRIAILKSRAERFGRQIPPVILEQIARLFQTNIRELEGAYNRVTAYADLSGLELTSQLVQTALTDLMPRQRSVNPNQVLAAVSRVFGLTADQLLGRNRSREVALPRQVAMYLLREEANASLLQIGETLGGRDHTTVMYACDKVADLIERDDRLRRQVIQVREQLYSPLPGI